eukprot:jgi/Mesvir1/17463/Mv26484-RA.1
MEVEMYYIHLVPLLCPARHLDPLALATGTWCHLSIFSFAILHLVTPPCAIGRDVA